ncbi:NTE family protein [Lutibacter agarilyticus]|uniref:NTE family protein n=1 Tax=Lutibacter agarilyticus TaxID=1109740 RepID=A0A238VCH9_9FLAO|nr:patatin-like phospholipase family protein [Lutibacter agarilyticus]SNR31966.1 NTE family protein [Lutibacter agarilyticus]
MKLLKIFILIIFITIPQLTFSQEKKPKVVVVLSGGGAKGVAHIPLLQALDSLNIVPDLIIGTSMGSIVGGLYSAGYSGDSIANIANNADWNYLLGGGISLKDVSVEEKSEFNKYVVDFDLDKGKPKVSTGLISDQNLREFLAVLTYPVYNIVDFDKLPIPYRAMATDIVNGKEIIMDKGSLLVAMRASMSIPTVFEPVTYKETLLVDGGVLNNFATDVAKEMGADIIIGSDVGGGMAPIEELDNIATLLFQTGMINSNLKNPENRKLCDVLIDHTEYLTYSTGDFTNSKEIYEQGKIGTNINMKALVDLSEQLKRFNSTPQGLPKIAKEFILDSIKYSGISKANIDLVKARANIKINTKYTTNDLIKGIDKAMGTQIFKQITFHSLGLEDKKSIEITGYEKAKFQIKGSLHYDTYRGVGLVLNSTARNLLGNSSRLLLSVDIAEQPRLRLQYQKNFGHLKSWWWRSEFFSENLKQKIFIDGNSADKMKYRFMQFDNQLNKNINSLNRYVGLGINYNYTNVKPENDPKYNDNILDLYNYRFNNIQVYAQYLFNNMNQVFYATNGTYFNAMLSRSLLHDTDVKFTKESIEDQKGNTNGFTKLSFDFEERINFNKKITGIIGATAGFIFEDDLLENQVSFTDFGYAAKYFLGGNMLNPRNGSFMFPGLHEDELNVNQILKLNLGIQFNPLNKVYLTPHFNIASVGFNNFDEYIKEAFSPKGDWSTGFETSTIMSAGATASYHSFLGPITFDASWVNDINKVRVFFNIGLVLNR